MKLFFKNKKNVLLFSIGAILIIVIIMMIVSNKNGTIVMSNSDAKKFEEDYEKLNNIKDDNDKLYPKVDIPSDNIIDYINSHEVLEIFENKKDAVIYFGNAKCLYCRSAIEVLCEASSETKLDKIYYLDMENNDDNYNKIISVISDSTSISGEIPLPLVLFVSYGDVVSYWKGTLFSQTDPYVKLDKSQKQGLREIYESGINDVLG